MRSRSWHEKMRMNRVVMNSVAAVLGAVVGDFTRDRQAKALGLSAQCHRQRLHVAVKNFRVGLQLRHGDLTSHARIEIFRVEGREFN